MSKKMYISCIVIGIILICVGAVGLTRHANSAETATENIRETTPASTGHNADEPPVHKSGESPATAIADKKEKGNMFEGFVADCFKDRQTFRVLEWNQGVTSPEGVYAENNVNPDFHIQQAFRDDFNIDY